MPVDPSNLDAIVAAARKKYGGDFIHPGNTMPPVYRIPFDSLELNLATWGGAPMGRMIRLWGDYSTAKTHIAWGLAKQAINHRSELFPDGLTVAYYNVEGAYDPTHVSSRLGVDISRVTIVEGGIIEDISRNLDSLLSARHIHIIDSVSYAQSIHGFEATKESRQPGFDAIAWKNALRSAEQNMDKRENMIILIDQVRVHFRTGGEKEAGGKVIGHASSMSIHHRKATKLYEGANGELTNTRPQKGNDDLTGTHRVDGYEIELEVNKSRVCRPFGKARLILDLRTMRFDNAAQFLKAGILLGVINKSGSWYSVPGSSRPIQGDRALKNRISQDPFLVNTILTAADKYIKENQY